MNTLLYSRLSTNIPVLLFQQTTESKKRTKRIQTDKQSPEMLTIKEVALRTGVSEHFIRILCKKKEIVYVKSGTKYLINYNKFQEFLNTGR